MKTAVKAFNDADEAERKARFHEMKDASEALRSFYKSLMPLAIMPAPDFREFSILAQEMPALTTYLHRAMSTMHEMNENLRERNSLIASHALEGAEGITPESFAYYVTMISGRGDSLCQSVDHNLEFFILTMEQIERFMTARNKGVKYLPFELVDQVREVLPEEDLFPALRSQMTTFDNPP